MASICFYFQVHQPFRVKDYRVFDIGRDNEYFNDDTERSINNKKISLRFLASSELLQ